VTDENEIVGVAGMWQRARERKLVSMTLALHSV
jgi:hypothetical protein